MGLVHLQFLVALSDSSAIIFRSSFHFFVLFYSSYWTWTFSPYWIVNFLGVVQIIIPFSNQYFAIICMITIIFSWQFRFLVYLMVVYTTVHLSIIVISFWYDLCIYDFYLLFDPAFNYFCILRLIYPSIFCFSTSLPHDLKSFHRLSFVYNLYQPSPPPSYHGGIDFSWF